MRYPGEPGYTRCTYCLEVCEVVEVDYGIGHYEFWGAKGFDSRKEWGSACCECSFELIECSADEYDSRPEYWDAFGPDQPASYVLGLIDLYQESLA